MSRYGGGHDDRERGNDRGGGGYGGYEDRDRGNDRRDRHNPAGRVYVGNVPDDITRDELHEFVGKYGRVVDIDIKHGKTSNGTAFAFITFEDERDADDCIRGRDGARFQDGSNSLRVRVERAGRDRRRNDRGPPRRTDFRCYVSGLPRGASWQDLKDFFRAVGDVGYANVENGVGVVEFHDRRDLDEAVRQMDGKEFTGATGSDVITVADRHPDEREDRGGGGRGRSLSPRRRSRTPERRRSRSRSAPRNRSVSPERDAPARSRSHSPARRQSGRTGSASPPPNRERSRSRSRSR